MHKKKVTIIVIMLLILTAVIGAIFYQDVTTRWIVVLPNNAPSVSLVEPTDDSTINLSTAFFNWTSSDPDSDPLQHMLFIDVLPTINTPHKITYNTGAVTNKTLSSLLDGIWYWKVEVSDGEDVNTSETWRFFMRENLTNNFPSILNSSISQNIGNPITIFYYRLTFTDLDNDTATSVKVYIDGNDYNMLEIDDTDTNTTDGKDYYYQTHLALGSHNYSFYVSDGVAINTTVIYDSPNVVPYINTLPHITLIGPNPAEIFNTNDITFYWNVTDVDGDLLYTEFWLWKGDTGLKEVYEIANGTTLSLAPDTYSWQILAVDSYGQNTSEKRTFGVIASGKQLSVTIQADSTTEKVGESFTGDLVITNEGPLESYEVYWYIELWNRLRTKKIASSIGSLAVTTTVSVSYEVEIPLDTAGGKYYLRAFGYDDDRAIGDLIGQDELLVKIEVTTITVTEEDIIWYSMFFDTPRYQINLDDYPDATSVRVPLSYNYSTFIFSGVRPLKDAEIYLVVSNVFIQLSALSVATGEYSFGGVTERNARLIVVPNPSVTDSAWTLNWLHKNDVR